MEDVDGLREPDCVNSTVGTRPIIFPQFQHARATEPLKYLGLKWGPTKLHKAQALTKLSVHTAGQGK